MVAVESKTAHLCGVHNFGRGPIGVRVGLRRVRACSRSHKADFWGSFLHLPIWMPLLSLLFLPLLFGLASLLLPLSIPCTQTYIASLASQVRLSSNVLRVSKKCSGSCLMPKAVSWEVGRLFEELGGLGADMHTAANRASGPHVPCNAGSQRGQTG